jgi:hypothetical protein
MVEGLKYVKILQYDYAPIKTLKVQVANHKRLALLEKM